MAKQRVMSLSNYVSDVWQTSHVSYMMTTKAECSTAEDPLI